MLTEADKEKKRKRGRLSRAQRAQRQTESSEAPSAPIGLLLERGEGVKGRRGGPRIKRLKNG